MRGGLNAWEQVRELESREDKRMKEARNGCLFLLSGLCAVAMLCCSCHRAADSSDAARGQDRLCKIMDEYLRRDPLEYRYAPPGYDYLFRGPLTMSQIEQEMLDRAGVKSIEAPTTSFGRRMYNKWTAFKEEYKLGDELYFFRTNQRSWELTAGREGYVLFRRNQVVEIWLTSCN